MVGIIAFALSTIVLILLLTQYQLPGIYVLILLLIWGFISSYGLYIFHRFEPVLGLFNMIRTERFNILIFKYSWLNEFITFLSRVSFNLMFGFLSYFLFPSNYRYKLIIYLTSMFTLLILSLMYHIAISKFYEVRSLESSISLPGLIFVMSGIVGWFVYSVITGFWRLITELNTQGQVTSTIVSPLIPGITLPFVESVIALGFVMVVHELAHAVVAISRNINIKSTGLVTYGGLPVGAFVEPDEYEFSELQDKVAKVDILLAGVGINLFFSMIFFLMFWGFYLVTEPQAIKGVCISDDVIQGKIVIIKTIDGQPCATAFLKNDSVLDTNYGQFVLQRYVKYAPLPSSPLTAFYDNNVIEFIYNLLFMLFAINTIVAITNIFPVYFLDGGQVINTVFGPYASKILSLTTGALLLLILMSVIFK